MDASVERVPLDEVRDLIAPGQELPFPVLDDDGRLLLNAGLFITSERQFALLLERGAWVERLVVDSQREAMARLAETKPARAVREPTLFDRWERTLWDLDALLRSTAKGASSQAEWLVMVDEFMTTVDRDADVAIFTSVRQEDRRYALYPLTHALHAAVLCLLCARQARWDLDRQRSLVGAALSMNVAMMDLQARMAEQDDRPSKAQMEVIRAHPERGVSILRATGVQDPVWLNAVADHHERADGGGYPKGSLTVSDEARVLRMADVYMAKITPRANRTPLPAMAASRQLFQQEPGCALVLSFLKAIGLHPPGSLVQLKSGEVAVVTRRAAGPAPKVRTLSDKSGQPTVNSVTLDSANAEHAILGPCSNMAAFPRVPPERVYGLMLA